jgi:RNA polymerase sigma factor (TIGR02999 family)
MTNTHQSKIEAQKQVRRSPEDPTPHVAANYDELRTIARYLRRVHGDPTLQTTELVHETYLRLIGSGPEKYLSRSYFFKTVGRAMYETMVDRARRRNARKRGAEWSIIPLDDVDPIAPSPSSYDELYSALAALETISPRVRQVVELRFLLGLSEVEVATYLRLGESTIRRDCTFAKAWLRRELA